MQIKTYKLIHDDKNEDDRLVQIDESIMQITRVSLRQLKEQRKMFLEEAKHAQMEADRIAQQIEAIIESGVLIKKEMRGL